MPLIDAVCIVAAAKRPELIFEYMEADEPTRVAMLCDTAGDHLPRTLRHLLDALYGASTPLYVRPSARQPWRRAAVAEVDAWLASRLRGELGAADLLGALEHVAVERRVFRALFQHDLAVLRRVRERRRERVGELFLGAEPAPPGAPTDDGSQSRWAAECRREQAQALFGRSEQLASSPAASDRGGTIRQRVQALVPDLLPRLEAREFDGPGQVYDHVADLLGIDDRRRQKTVDRTVTRVLNERAPDWRRHLASARSTRRAPRSTSS